MHFAFKIIISIIISIISIMISIISIIIIAISIFNIIAISIDIISLIEITMLIIVRKIIRGITIAVSMALTIGTRIPIQSAVGFSCGGCMGHSRRVGLQPCSNRR